MSFVRFLLFSGKWENEANFYLIENENTILILAAGKGYSRTSLQEQEIGINYLRENKDKVKGVILANTNYWNIGSLAEVLNSLEDKVPVHTNSNNKLILNYLFPQIQNQIVLNDKCKDLKIDIFSIKFFALAGYLVGNEGLLVSFPQNNIYFIESFAFSNLLKNKVLLPNDFLKNLQENIKGKENGVVNYLVTSFQGIHWNNDNSLFHFSRNLPYEEKPSFFILYEFDWLHILELIEIIQKRREKLLILNFKFTQIIEKLLKNNPSLKDTIKINKEEGEKNLRMNYLLVGNPDNMEELVRKFLVNLEEKKTREFNFIVGIPPVIGGEEKLARIVDFLYTKSDKIINLSKKDYFNLGINFHDFNFLINEIIQPDWIIALQDSYKNVKYLEFLPNKFISLNNGYAWDITSQKNSQLRRKKDLISLEELLIKQRENLGNYGLLLVIISSSWKNEENQLVDLCLENLAVNSDLDLEKLKLKIKDWWKNKVFYDVKKEENSKIIKKIVERRLSRLISNYLTMKMGIEMGEIFILYFLAKNN